MMTSLTRVLKMSIDGEMTTFSGRPFHKRMVFGKNVSLSSDVRERGMKNLLLWPLVGVLSGINWSSQGITHGVWLCWRAYDNS